MVPMLRCGLVRSNLAFATGVPPGTRVVVRSWCGDWCHHVGRTRSTGRLFGDDGVRPVGVVARALLYDRPSNAPSSLGTVAELHRVRRATLRLRTQVTDVAEHLGQRQQGANHLSTAGVLHRLELAS